MTDIVERLRKDAEIVYHYGYEFEAIGRVENQLSWQAADEIEQLRMEKLGWIAKAEELSDYADKLAAEDFGHWLDGKWTPKNEPYITQFTGNGTLQGPIINLHGRPKPKTVKVTAISLNSAQYFLTEENWRWVEQPGAVQILSVIDSVNASGEQYYLEVEW